MTDKNKLQKEDILDASLHPVRLLSIILYYEYTTASVKQFALDKIIIEELKIDEIDIQEKVKALTTIISNRDFQALLDVFLPEYHLTTDGYEKPTIAKLDPLTWARELKKVDNTILSNILDKAKDNDSAAEIFIKNILAYSTRDNKDRQTALSEFWNMIERFFPGKNFYYKYKWIFEKMNVIETKDDDLQLIDRLSLTYSYQWASVRFWEAISKHPEKLKAYLCKCMYNSLMDDLRKLKKQSDEDKKMTEELIRSNKYTDFLDDIDYTDPKCKQIFIRSITNLNPKLSENEIENVLSTLYDNNSKEKLTIEKTAKILKISTKTFKKRQNQLLPSFSDIIAELS